MQRFNQQLILLLCCCFAMSTSWAQSDETYQVNFRYGAQQFEANTGNVTAIPQVQAQERFSGKYYRFIQFYQIPTQIQRENMEAMGIDFLEYIPNNVYLAAIPNNFNEANFAALDIRSVQPVGLSQKLDQRLEERPLPIWAMNGSQVNVYVQFYANIEPFDAVSALKEVGFQLLEVDGYAGTAITVVNPNQVEDLAKLPFIRYVDLPSQPGEPESDDGRNLHRSNMIDRDYYGSYAYDGTGISVAVNDDGYVGPHIDFEGRTDQTDVAGDFAGTHGDMVAGIVGAAGNVNPIYRGMAPGAFLWIRQYSSSLPNTLSLHQNDNVMVFSSSYSNGCNAGYTTLTRTVDLQIYNNPNLIQVFSAGNSNNSDCGYGAGDQWGNITGGHKMGKNVMATANLQFNDVITGSSSRGPANDGRIKPDISAHGTNHISTDPDHQYSPGGGTSAAAPGITGVLAQLHQAYSDLNSGTTAPSALLKAAVMNTANDLGTDGPDFTFGWGKVNAYRAMKTLEENRYMSDTIAQGNTDTYTLNIPAGVSRARIMVYWHDKEASTSASTALVNNLNLTVTSGASTYHPWVLNHAPNASTLDDPATRTGTVDNLNNVEQVAIDNPAAGTYTININAATVPFGPQEYYVVYEYLTDDVMVTFPVGGEGLIPGANDRIHWDAYGTSGTFNVEVSTDNGTSWSTVQSSVPGSARFISWTVPTTITGQARVRVTRGANSDESDANFTIIDQPTNIQVAAVCTTANAIRITWDTVAGATNYDVFKLGTMYMDSVGTTTGGASVYDVPVANINDTVWMAVRAIGPNGIIGLRSIAYQYIGSQGGGASCFLDCGQNNDAGVGQITSPNSLLQTCDGTTFPVEVDLVNLSTNNQTGFNISYQLDAQTPVVETFSGTLAGGGQASYTFTNQLTIAGPGNYTLKVWTDLAGDGAICNDTVQIPINYYASIATFPYTEDFESGTFPPANAYIINVDDDLTWEEDNVTGSNGSNTTAIRMNCYNYAATNQEDVFGIVNIDLSTALSAQATFDVAYARYSATYSDGLRVEASSDCGQTWTSIWSKDGSALATVGDQTSRFSPSSGSDWRNEVIDLTSYTGGDVALRFISENGYGNDMYVDNINVNLINSAPTAQFSASTTTSCNGLVSFSDLSNNSPTSWSWDFGDGNSSTDQNPIHTYASNGTYTVTFIATNGVGSDTIVQTNYITVTYPAAPTTSTTVDGCVGDPLTLSGSSSSTTLWWYDSNGNFVGDGNTITTPAITGNTTFEVVAATGSAVANVGPADASVPGSGAHVTFAAYLNFSTTSAVNIKSAWVDCQTAGNRTIYVYDADDGGGNIVDQVTVFVPQGQGRIDLDLFVPASGNYSIGGTLNLFRNDNSASYNYPYSNGLVSINSSSAGAPTSYYYFLYDWEVEDATICKSAPVTVTVNADEANFTDDANSSVLSVNFTDQSTGATSWSWDFGDGNTSTTQSPSHTYAAAGNYTVTLTINGTCSITQTIAVGVTAVTNVDVEQFDANLQPNPAMDQTVLTLKDPLNEDMMVELITVDGRVLQSYQLRAGNTALTIHCDDLPPAMYFIRMKTDAMTQSRKFVVKR